MSEQNRRTVKVYQETGYKYLENSAIHDKMDVAKAAKKRDKLMKLITTSFKDLPAGAKIFEIGSGSGDNAQIMQEMGFDVTASDTADDFINATGEKCAKVIMFDAVEDNFPGKFSGVFCWRVFVHFTEDDALTVIKKVYDALEEGGVFIFNAINRETRPVDNEWVDFQNEYRMGVDRFYSYFREQTLNNIIAQTNFVIKDFHKEGGDNGDKWLVYVLEKPCSDRFILNFMEYPYAILKLPRTGWIESGVPRRMVETVGEHTLLTQGIAKSVYAQHKDQYTDVNIDRVCSMLYIHDWAEALIGDYTPDQISKEEKKKLERDAIEKICRRVADGDEIKKLFIEFDERKTPNAFFAYQCDKAQCDLMAIKYGKEGLLTLERMRRMKGKNVAQRTRIKAVKESGLPMHVWWVEHNLNHIPYDDNFRALIEYALKNS